MNSPRFKAAQIIGDAALGGGAASVLNYYRFTDRSRWQFDFFVYRHSSFDASVNEIDPQARIFIMPRLDTKFYKAIPFLKKQFALQSYSVVHSHMTTLSLFPLYAAKSARIPVRICHAHSTFNKHSDRFLAKSILRPFADRYATHRIACSNSAADCIFRKNASLAEILPNAIDTRKFCPLPEPQRQSLREKLHLYGRVLLFVGRFAPQKNLFFLLRSFSYACRVFPMTLVLVGTGSQEPALRKYAESSGILDKVRFQPPCDPLPWYQSADTFVLPSLYEGLPVVAAEAQSVGLPCLFSDQIDRAADLSGHAAFLPLDEKIWAKRMARPLLPFSDGPQSVRRAGYDIRTQAHTLTRFYDLALLHSVL